MARELYLYSHIHDFSAELLITAMEEARDEDITLRINTDGGSPEATWGIAAKLSEHKGGKNIKVDGKAYSGGLFMLCYVDFAECWDVSQFMLHRAAYPRWFEGNSEFMTEPLWENLNNINKMLRSALEAKIDVKKLEEMKGVKMKDIFSNESRIDVMLTAKEAKQIGLIQKINKLTPDKKAEIDSMMLSIAASGAGVDFPEPKEEPKTKPMSEVKMTVEKLKAEHPEVYNSVMAIGIEKEKDRAQAWMTFAEIDPKAVAEGIKEGKEISQSAMAEFTMKSISASALKQLEKEGAGTVETGAAASTEETEEQKKVSAFTKEAIEAAKQLVKN